MSQTLAAPANAGIPTPGPGCIACGGAAWTPKFQILRQCAGCGFVRADMDVSEEEIKKLYQADYFRGEEYGDYLADVRVHEKNFAHRFKEIAAVAGRLESIFEVGCAYGMWLAECRRQGVRAAGVDICEEPTAYARNTLGLDAACGDFLKLDIEPGAWPAYCMWDTIEHLAHPEAFVEKISRLLPPGGWFFCTTGDIGARQAVKQGPRWRMIHPPTHLQYFSADTMRRFLGRHGLEAVSLTSTPVYRSVAGVLSGLANFGKGFTRRAARIGDAVTPGFAKRSLGFWLDLGDIMLVCAVKK